MLLFDLFRFRLLLMSLSSLPFHQIGLRMATPRARRVIVIEALNGTKQISRCFNALHGRLHGDQWGPYQVILGERQEEILKQEMEHRIDKVLLLSENQLPDLTTIRLSLEELQTILQNKPGGSRITYNRVRNHLASGALPEGPFINSLPENDKQRAVRLLNFKNSFSKSTNLSYPSLFLLVHSDLDRNFSGH